MTRRSSKSSGEEAARSRYPGARPFSDSPDDYARFFGRTEEGEQLYLRVLSVPLLVQFGKSGLGKTSLLQAWLFPRLRQKPFLPVMVRLNVSSDTLTAAVARAIRQTCETEGLEFTEKQPGGLWELLSTTTIWREDLLLTPVLVFDQFEEVFTLRDAAFRADLASELGAVASGIPPARLQAGRSRGGEGLDPRPNLKIVISLREDYLGALEEFSAAIPGLFHERLRLEPLTQKAASEAVIGPAQLTAGPGEQPYWAPRFSFESPALDSMIAYLRGSSGVIEPFQLQLLCRHAEAIVHGKARSGVDAVALTPADFNGTQGFASVLKHFYRDTLRKLAPSQRRKAQKLCEEGLLGASGHRLMLEEAQIRNEFGVKGETLTTLSQERLVRRERRLESAFYEISHDRLAESIFGSRAFRLPPTVKRVFWTAGAAAVLIVSVLIWSNYSEQNARVRAEAELQATEGLLNTTLFTMRDELLRTGNLDLLEETTQKSLEYLDRQATESDSPVVARRRSVGMTTMGDVLSARGDTEGALKWYREALGIDENLLAQDPENPERLLDASIDHSGIGNALLAAGDLTGASTSYHEALAIAGRLMAADPANARGQDQLTSAHLAMGALLFRQNDAPAALQSYREALAVAERLVAADPTNERGRSQLASAHMSVGYVLLGQNDVPSALQSYRDALAIAEPLAAADPTNVERQRLLANAHMSLGDALLKQNNARAAMGSYRPALAITEQLAAADPSNAERQNSLSWILVVLGRAHNALGEPQEARKALERAVSLSKPVADRDISYLDTYAQALLSLGRIDEARPVVDELLKKGWKDPDFLELCRKSGLL